MEIFAKVKKIQSEEKTHHNSFFRASPVLLRRQHYSEVIANLLLQYIIHYPHYPMSYVSYFTGVDIRIWDIYYILYYIGL